jgi:mannose-6-phosphate isomerase-like protein (cupin superfamily)
VAHPKDTDAAVARRFGAAEGRTRRFDAADPHPLQQLLARQVYVGEGGVAAATARKELLTVPRGVAVRAYGRDTEEALLVLAGQLTVGWEEDGVVAEARLGRRDAVLTPAGRVHWFRNDGAADAEVWMVVGGAGPETVGFVAG